MPSYLTGEHTNLLETSLRVVHGCILDNELTWTEEHSSIGNFEPYALPTFLFFFYLLVVSLITDQSNL